MQKCGGRRLLGVRVTTAPPLWVWGDTMRLGMSTPFSDPPDQLGCVVPDLQAAISDWAVKGVGPFLTMREVTLGGYLVRRLVGSAIGRRRQAPEVVA
jgi:hypothetical protein